MKIIVLGTRGFPNVQGGVEKHCENLYPQLVKKGYEVIVFTREPYVDSALDNYKGVKLISLSCPKNKFLEAFVHIFNGILAAKRITRYSSYTRCWAVIVCAFGTVIRF